MQTTDAVIITGSGRGIGAATALLAAARGYSVCVNYRENRVSYTTGSFLDVSGGR